MNDIDRRGLPKYLIAYIEYKKEVAQEVEGAALKELAAKETPALVKEYIDYLFATTIDGATIEVEKGKFNEIPISYKEYALEEIIEEEGSKCKTPTATPAAGTYTGEQTVALATTTEDATIYYTTDGSTPTSASTEYTSEITVSATTTIKAIAVKAGMIDSDPLEALYTIE